MLLELGPGHELMLEPCTHTPAITQLVSTSQLTLADVDADDATTERGKLASIAHSAPIVAVVEFHCYCAVFEATDAARSDLLDAVATITVAVGKAGCHVEAGDAISADELRPFGPARLDDVVA